MRHTKSLGLAIVFSIEGTEDMLFADQSTEELFVIVVLEVAN